MTIEANGLSAAFLISTPCLFKATFESSFSVSAQVPSNVGDQRHLGEPGPFEHHFYVVQVPVKRVNDFIFEYAFEPKELVGLFSLIYGKRIQLHGPIWLPGGGWSLPDLLGLIPNDYHRLAPYGGERKDISGTECTWAALSDYPQLPQWCSLSRTSQQQALIQAAECYGEALRLLAIDIEIAYFRLIQALETASATVTFSDEERFSHDAELSGHLAWLNSIEDSNGPRIAKFLKRRLYQVKRGVSLWVEQHVTMDFFLPEKGALTAASLQSAVSAAYDLRSAYVHAGSKFGSWIEPARFRCGESETVPPSFAELCSDAPIAKALRHAPSFLGLERLVRHCVLNAVRLAPAEAG